MQILPYLHFDGRCEEAFQFYERCLGGKIIALSRFSEAPPEMQMPAALKDKIMHVRLEADGAMLMGSDAPPERYQKTQGCSVSVLIEDPARVEAIFKALSEGASIDMPLQATFWAQRFGMLHDKFGIPWMVNCEGGRR